ncbi:hypothetical protein RAM80_05710 [Pseudomonas sp. App30]|uniref:dermonecrotic toxin domain-containing protein n=1 Tax=Pseudomonas sp. App30 TaxID=3068990 RepID=UPI003A7F6D5B
MPTPIVHVPFFHPDLLRSRFISNVSQAFRDERLSQVEHDWLLLADKSPDTLRVDQPLLAPDQRLDPQLAGAMVFSYPDPANPSVYLWTLLDGIQPFTDRTALETRLRTLQGAPQAQFELEQVQQPLFDSISATYVLQRADHLAEAARWFGQLPSLDGQLHKRAETTLSAHFSDKAPDADNVWLQRVSQHDGTVRQTQTLAEYHLQVFAGQPLASDEQLNWLPHDDQPLSDETRTALQATLDESFTALPDAYVAALQQAWQPQRASLAQLYGAAFYQALLQARANGQLLGEHWPWLRAALTGGQACGLALAEHGETTPLVTVAGALLIADPAGPSVYVYDGQGELQRHASHMSLMLYLTTLPEAPAAVGQADHEAWAGLARPQLLTPPLGPTPLLACMDAIAQCQARNLRSCLLQRGASPGRAMVLVDQALDVRGLLDQRLLNLDPTRRWRPVPLLQQGVLLARPGALKQTAQWMKQLHEFNNRHQALRGGIADLEESAADVLDPALSVISAHLSSQSVTFDLSAPGDEQPLWVSLADVLVERVSRPEGRPRWLPAAQEQHGGVLQALPKSLVTALLNHAGSRLDKTFTTVLEADRGLRLQGLWAWPQAESRQIREGLLRLELGMQRRFGKLAAGALDPLQQVLDYPLEHQRPTGAGQAKAHGVSVRFNDRPEAVLSNVFVVHTDGDDSGQVLLWSVLAGVEVFSTRTLLLQSLGDRLRTPPLNVDWLSLLPPDDDEALSRALGRTPEVPLSLSTWPITDSVPRRLQLDERRRQRQAARSAYQLTCTLRFSGELVRRYVHLTAVKDALTTYLQGLDTALDYWHLKTTLPSWLTDASSQELTTYTALVGTCARLQALGEDYLFDIPDLRTFTRGRVTERLQQDLGDKAPQPDDVLITLRHFTPGLVGAGEIPSQLPAATQVQRETLTTAAIDQLTLLPGTPAILEMTDASPLPAGLDSDYVRKMVASLDVASQYRQLLATRLSPDDADYATRQLRYSRQLTAELITAAYQQKLAKRLSDTAYRYVAAVLTMPDALARQPLAGVDVVIRPLQFQAASYLDPDTATGMHLIGPKDITQGPLVLYTPYNEQSVFREYANADDLLAKLRTDTAMQAEVIAQLDPAISNRYARHGFNHPHLPMLGESPLDVELRPDGTRIHPATPVAGSALHYLFQDNLVVLKRANKTATVTTEEANWTTFRYLMTLGIEQGSILLPGSLAKVLNLWQSESWFQASIDAASRQRWGEALTDFVAALGLLAGSENSAEHMMGIGRRLWPAAPRPAAGLPAIPNFRLEAAKTERISLFEAPEVDLRRMTFDTSRNVYVYAHELYVVIQGRVCKVREENGQWFLTRDQREGPRIEWQASGAWELVISVPPLSNGYNILRILDQHGTDQQINRVFITQYKGMARLFTGDPAKAQQVCAAHAQASHYLITALENLNARQPQKSLPARTESLLMDTFGVAATTPKLLHQVRRALTSVLSGLQDRSLEPLNSRRLIFGLNRPGYTRTHGFVFRGDHHRRIFLTEQFFQLDFSILLNVDPLKRMIDPLLHAQATTLIHEVSHQANRTTDIAYLNSGYPPVDTLYNTSAGQQFYIQQLNMHRRGLSLQTPHNRLFKVEDRTSGVLRDLADKDGKALERVYKHTATTELDAAREVFMLDPLRRAQVILDNADSVTLLATSLGRELW